MLGGQKIPYKLDLACPIALPIKSGGEPIGWPITWCALLQVTKLMSSAAQIEPDRTVSVDIHDLYLAALFLPEDLFPLTHYTADLIGHLKALSSVDASSALTRCMLALPDIEHKHRRCLLPVLAALADVTSAPEIKRVRVEDAVAAAEMDSRELEAVKAAMALRMGCRAVEDGHGVVVARRIAEEYERREIMLQIILLLALLAVHPPTSTATADTDTSKKRKRRRDRGTPPPPRIDPLAQPAEALDLLFDRVAVWMMVAELDTGIAQAVAQGDGKRQGVELAVHRLWKHVIHPHFLHSLPAQCASFHLKVFNKPLQPASMKKPRKPQLTRAKPSSDDIPIAPARDTAGPSRLQSSARTDRRGSFSRIIDQPQGAGRATSRMPSRRSSPSASSQHGASLAPTGTDMRRSTSHTSLEARMRSRSRSMSVDPARQQDLEPEASRRNSGNAGGSASALTRQPSGKDLFKGRQVGLLRRSASGVMRRTSSEKDKEESQGQSQVRKGLFGRQTSGGQSQTQTINQTLVREKPVSSKDEESNRKAETLIMATPSKPRFFDPHGRYRTAQGPYEGYYAPTPIIEEPRSERPTRVAETPVAARISHTLFGQKRKVAPTAVPGSEDDVDGDPFGELMVPTDDEDDGEEAGWAGVPETPAR